jgi:hypothetical protein
MTSKFKALSSNPSTARKKQLIKQTNEKLMERWMDDGWMNE